MNRTGGGEQGRVLVVDDDPAITRMLGRVLDWSYEVVTYNDPAIALAAIAAGARFDLILCDVFMPHLDGESFYAQVRDLCPATAARIVFLTGAPSNAPGAAFLGGLPNRRVMKPFDVGELRSAVADIIRISGRWETAR